MHLVFLKAKKKKKKKKERYEMLQRASDLDESLSPKIFNPLAYFDGGRTSAHSAILSTVTYRRMKVKIV
jgi:hypothetical protein